MRPSSALLRFLLLGTLCVGACTSPQSAETPPAPVGPVAAAEEPEVVIESVRPSLEPRDEAGEHFNATQKGWIAEHLPWGAPEYLHPGSHTMIVRQGYVLSHNNVDLIADWVEYHLTSAYVHGNEPRPNPGPFAPDPQLAVGHRAELVDYKGSGYDRGHQCPNADARGRGMQVVKESFYLSNMTPQDSQLNQHGWANLEGLVRTWAEKRGEVWVITGPAFFDEHGAEVVNFKQVGPHHVAVPTHYFKIVVAKTSDGHVEALAFLIPNVPMDQSPEHYLVSIDRVEAVTGLDVLSGLPDPEEHALEAATPTHLWN